MCVYVPYLSYDLSSFFKVDWRESLREGSQVVISAVLEEIALLDGMQDEFVCVVRFRDRLRRAYATKRTREKRDKQGSRDHRDEGSERRAEASS